MFHFVSVNISLTAVCLDEGEICDMLVVQALDPDNIICQPMNTSGEREELMKTLANTYKGSYKNNEVSD